MTTGIELIWYELTSGKILNVVKRPFPPSHSPSLTRHTNPHTYTHTFTEAVVLFDYEKQQDDELSLKVGDIITDVKQVREQYVH